MGDVKEFRTDADVKDAAARHENDDKASTISAALAAGTKLPLPELEWFLKYCSQRYFHQRLNEPCVKWRNKSKQTIYCFVGLTLRVTDARSDDKGSPVYVYVSYAPIERPEVIFSREGNEFLRKFEPVYEATSWQRVDLPVEHLPGVVL